MSADFLHVVLFKVRPDTDATLLRTLWDELHMLRSIQGVRSLEVGPAALAVFPGYTDRTAGFTHCLVMRLKDAEALERYAKSPAHVAFVQKLLRVLEKDGLLAIDYYPLSPQPVGSGVLLWSALALAVGLGAGLALHKYLPKM